jgi:hypothetical protein
MCWNKAGSGLCWILLASAHYGCSSSLITLLAAAHGFQPWGWGDTFSFDQIPNQEESEILVGIFSLT